MKLPPWMFILLGWAVLLAATTLTVRICLSHNPQEVPLESSSAGHDLHAP